MINLYFPQHYTFVETPASQSALGISGNRAYTDDEKKVLIHTSHINSNVFVPFMNVDLQEKFVYSIPFTDKVFIYNIRMKLNLIQ